FFLARCAAYFIIWGWTTRYFLKRSVQQDGSGDVDLTLRMERWSGSAIVFYAFTATFASFDLIMSLDAHWYSTIFGVYFFAGCAVGFFSLLALVTMWVQSTGRLTESITVEHYHDIGKWIFTFVFFWGYIGFSQYMLIWYADLPEETSWIFARQTGTWVWAALLLLFGHFCVPFTVMLSRTTKRRLGLLGFFAAWMLVMHWVDMWWMITPRLSPGRLRFDWMHVTCLIGLGGLFVAGLAWQAGRRSLLPEQDPRLPESLAFENA
ncbi:MAG TPA: quinol:cytochrome C oxidoreductase, partial [Phycisphaerae bacterium]|nr:quinol:cytochrome C oxidoreductase [Phycisphaerae bacterium]